MWKRRKWLVMTNNNNPWSAIDSNIRDGSINGRRVDTSLAWDIFWALDSGKRCLLVFRHQAVLQFRARTPKLRGLEIVFSEPDRNGTGILFLQLLDHSQRDIFHRLCLDILGATAQAKTESDAVSMFLARTWRWHHLLRGGLDSKLSKEEQKGLMGELLVIENLLLPSLSASDAVAAWTGPLGAPKDFEIGRLCIEAKARRGAASPFVTISSEHQLDTSGVDYLYLNVVELDGATVDSIGGHTLPDIASRVRDQLALHDVEAVFQFERLLIACGFRWEDDYKDSRWVQGANQIFAVLDLFPRITSISISPGVSNVKYSIALKDCTAYLVSTDTVIDRLKGAKDDRST
jgi:Putative  PD-(D/E)XK family member, (DUF4420)